MSAVAPWYALARKHLTAAGFTEIEPLAPGSPMALLHFRHRGARFAMASRGRVFAYGVATLPVGFVPRGGVERLPAMRLRSRTANDRRGLAWGLNGQPVTGDSTFDAGVYVESDAIEADLLAVLGAAPTRSEIVTLLTDPGVSEVTLGELGSLVTMTIGRDDPAKLMARLDALGALAATLPTPSRPPHPWIVTGASREAIAWILLALFAWMFPIFYGEHHAPYRGGFGLAVAGASLVLYLLAMIVQVVRHRGRTRGLFMVMLSAVSLAVLCPSIVASAMLVANDGIPSAQVIRPAQVEDLRCRSNGRRSTCSLKFRTLDDDELHWASDSSSLTHEPGIAGDCGPAEVIEREGGLGFARLEQVRRTARGGVRLTRCASER
jgi:hypothetical protein